MWGLYCAGFGRFFAQDLAPVFLNVDVFFAQGFEGLSIWSSCSVQQQFVKQIASLTRLQPSGGAPVVAVASFLGCENHCLQCKQVWDLHGCSFMPLQYAVIPVIPLFLKRCLHTRTGHACPLSFCTMFGNATNGVASKLLHHENLGCVRVSWRSPFDLQFHSHPVHPGSALSPVTILFDPFLHVKYLLSITCCSA